MMEIGTKLVLEKGCLENDCMTLNSKCYNEKMTFYYYT